jgi:prephenate dehydrogenase
MSSHVAILGPGLLGGSLALALKARTGASVAVWARREAAVEEVKARGCADLVSTDARRVVADADTVVFATPIGAMPGLAAEIAPHVRPAALVTDVGSVKAPVCAELAPIFHGRAKFIGSHPMAGSERSGLEAAKMDLFREATCIVTPGKDTPVEAVEAATLLWQSVGGVVKMLSPEDHDRVVAWISHLPHLLAACLVQAVADAQGQAFDFCGPGFRDTTRVAGGPPDMWTEILAENRAAVREAVDGLIEKLRGVSTLLASAPPPERAAAMKKLLTEAKAQRDGLRFPKNLSDA